MQKGVMVALGSAVLFGMSTPLAKVLGGSVSPPVMGWLKDYTGSFAGGLYALAGFSLLAAVVAAVAVRETPAARPVSRPAAAATG